MRSRWAVVLLCLFSIPWNVSLFLVSPWGGERLAGVAERLFHSVFRGQLLLGTIQFRGPGLLVVEPLLAIDPHGEPATSIDSLRLRFSPLGLLRGELAVEELRIERPLVWIEAEDPVGGLGGVFLPWEEPRPRPPGGEPEPPEAPFPLLLHALRIEGGAFLLAPRRGERQVWAEGIVLFAEGSWREELARLALSLHADARMPVEAPLDLQLRAELSGWDLLLLELVVTLGETEILAEGKGDILELWGDVRLEGRIGPKQTAPFGVSLSRELPFSGTFHLARESRGNLRIEPPGGGRLDLDIQSRDFLHHRGRLVLRHLDPSAVLQGAPSLALSGRGSFEATLSPGPPSATFSLDLDRSASLGPGRIRFRVRGQEAEVETFELELPGGQARAEGFLRPDALRLRLRLDVDDLAALLSLLEGTLDLPPLRGRGRAELLVEGNPSDPSFRLGGNFPLLEMGELSFRDLALQSKGRLEPPRGELDATADTLRFRQVELDRLRLHATRSGEGVLRFRLRADRGEERDAAIAKGHVQPRGRRLRAELEAGVSRLGALWLEADLPTGTPRLDDPLRLDLRVDPLDLARLGGHLGLALPPAILRGHLSLAGRARNPRAEAHLFATRLRPLPEGPAVDAELHLRLRDKEASAQAQAWERSGMRILEFSAQAPLDAWRLWRAPEAALAALRDSPRARASLRLRGIDLATWAAGTLPDLDGALLADLDLRGPLRSPLGEARLEVSAGPLGPLGRLDLVVAARSTEEEVALDLLGMPAEQASFRLVGRIGAPLAAIFPAPAQAPLSLFWHLPSLDLAGLPWREGLDGAPLGRPRLEALAGTLSTYGHLRGSLEALRGRAVIDAQDLAYGPIPLGSLGLRLDLDAAPDLRLFAIDPRAGTLEARIRMEEGTAVSPRNLRRLTSLPWEMELHADAYSLRPLSLLPALVVADGELFADLSARGRMDAHFPTGSLSVQRGVVQPVGALRYDRVGLRAAFTPDRVDVSLLEAHARRGLAVLQGELVGSPRAFDFDFRLRSRELPVGGAQGEVALVTTRGEIEGRFDEALVADVRLTGATVELPSLGGRQLHDLAPPDDVVLFEEERPTRAGGPSLPLRVEISSSAPLRVRGPDVALDAEVGLGLHSTPEGALVASGAVEAQRGQLSLFGRTFDVEPSRVQWIEAPLGNPSLDLRARFQTVGATAWIDVGGTASAPVVNLRSDPPMSEGEIAVLIAAGGGRTEGLTPAEGEPVDGAAPVLGAAASVFGAVAGDRILQALGPGVPIDVLTVEAEEGRTLLQAGTRIGPRLFLGYARNLFPEPWENANEVRVRYQLSRPLAVESRYGDAGNGGVDLVWVEQFPTAAQSARRRKAGEEEAPEGEAPIGALPEPSGGGRGLW